MTSNISSEKMEFKTIAYAARINDSDTLHQSSSGGMFTALSDYVLNAEGAVASCIYSFTHTIIYEGRVA